MTIREEFLDNIKAVVVERGTSYGDPNKNFRDITQLWNVWLKIRHNAEFELDSMDVAILMDLMKTARLAGDIFHEDSWTDKGGYTACGFDVMKADKSKPVILSDVSKIVQQIIDEQNEIPGVHDVQRGTPVDDHRYQHMYPMPPHSHRFQYDRKAGDYRCRICGNTEGWLKSQDLTTLQDEQMSGRFGEDSGS